MNKGATFSPCGKYRYELCRSWEPEKGYALIIGLNPSTANSQTDDPTIRRCVEFAKSWGYGELIMANLFAYRATDPKVMKSAVDPVGPDNDDFLNALAEDAKVIVAAWGNHGTHRGRNLEVVGMLENLHCLKLTKSGQPMHPLYLPKTLTPKRWLS